VSLVDFDRHLLETLAKRFLLELKSDRRDRLGSTYAGIDSALRWRCIRAGLEPETREVFTIEQIGSRGLRQPQSKFIEEAGSFRPAQKREQYMEEYRCRIVVVETEDCRCTNLLDGVIVTMEIPRCLELILKW